MSINDRLRKLESTIPPNPREAFNALVDGEYDQTKTLRENLRAAELPPGAIPIDPTAGSAGKEFQ